MVKNIEHNKPIVFASIFFNAPDSMRQTAIQNDKVIKEIILNRIKGDK
jgi:hypothetical protein